MPIYEYQCPKCGQFEAMQKVSDKPLKCKPDCSESDCPKRAERIISAAAFHLKGSGWYKTDYSSGTSTTSSSKSSSDKSASKSDTSSSENSSEKKNDTKESSGKKDGSKTPSGSGSCGSGCGCH